MSFMSAKAEIRQGDLIQARAGKRVFDVTVTGIDVTGATLTVRCEITGEVPAWLVEQIDRREEADRERAERKASRRRWPHRM